MPDINIQSETGRDIGLERTRVSILVSLTLGRRLAAGRGRPVQGLACESFSVTNRKTFINNELGKTCWIGRRRNCAGMSGGNLALGQVCQDDGRQGKQAHHIGNMATALGHGARYVFLCVAVPINQLAIGLGLFNRIEISPLDILDNADFQRLLVGEVANKGRHFMQTCPLRSPPAALASDNFISLALPFGWTNQDWLDDTLFGDRGCKRFQFGLCHGLARLVGIRADQFDCQHPDTIP